MLVRGVRARSVTSSSYRGTPHPVSSMSGGRERTREAKGEPDGAQVSNRPSASAWMKPDDGHADCRHSRIGIRHAGIKRAWTTDETPTEPGSRSRRVSVRRARERRCARSRSRLARRAWGRRARRSLRASRARWRTTRTSSGYFFAGAGSKTDSSRGAFRRGDAPHRRDRVSSRLGPFRRAYGREERDARSVGCSARASRCAECARLFRET